MAYETGAVIEADMCAGEDTWAGIVDPVNVITGLVLLDEIDCVPAWDNGGLVVVSDALSVTPRFPNNVNNTHNQSIQRKTECHTTFKV